MYIAIIVPTLLEQEIKEELCLLGTAPLILFNGVYASYYQQKLRITIIIYY